MIANLATIAQNNEVAQLLEIANEHYTKQQFELAAASYQKVLIKEPQNNAAKFNLANTWARLGKQGEAMKSFTEIADYTTENSLKANAYYNKAVILSQQKRLEESIDIYKKALRLNSEDKEARENLQKALLELKKKEPPKKDNNKKQKQNRNQSPKMEQKEAEQRLKLLEQKEKEVQQRLQKLRSQKGNSQPKDW